MCGSPNLETVEYEGYFDIDTPPDVIVRAGLMLTAAEQARIAGALPQGSRLDMLPPPLTLDVEPAGRIVMHGE